MFGEMDQDLVTLKNKGISNPQKVNKYSFSISLVIIKVELVIEALRLYILYYYTTRYIMSNDIFFTMSPACIDYACH